MRQSAAGRTTLDRLIAHLVQGGDEPVATELRAWLAGSPRFRAFAQAHRDKVRKKLRTAGDVEAVADVRAELRVAHLLLGDPRIELDYEPFGSTKGGPDFSVRYRGGRPLTLEVTRIRRAPGGVHHGAPLLAKLRQLRPGMANALVVAINAASADELDASAAVAALRRRADVKEEEFFTRRHLAGSRDFYARFLRLGGVVVWCESAPREHRARLWTNASARIPLPERASRACVECLSEGG